MPDEVLCASCTQALSQSVLFPLADCRIGFGLACGVYQDHVRNAILAWKDHRDLECDGPLSTRLIALAQHPQLHTWLIENNPIVIVPAPSSARSIRKRGRRQLDPLVQRLAYALQAQGIRVSTVPLLCVERVRAKSIDMQSAHDRKQRISGHVVIDKRRALQVPRRSMIVVIDDIVTSGATIRECTHVLQRNGYSVLTALALAYTPPRNRDDDQDIHE